MKSTERSRLLVPTAEAWAEWLERNCSSCTGIWLHLGKKGRTIPAVTYAEALEVALCYGWIDGQKKAFDGNTFVQRFTPRTAKSIWSETNREAALRLIDIGRMKPSGLAAIETAKANGRWEAAYESSSKSTVPADLQAALDENAKAKAFFETLDRLNRYAILFRIQTAVKPETRASRIAKFVEMLAKKQKIHSSPPPGKSSKEKQENPK